MERSGQTGQFRIVWRIPLGGDPKNTLSPQKEPLENRILGMPDIEDDWVKNARTEYDIFKRTTVTTKRKESVGKLRILLKK